MKNIVKKIMSALFAVLACLQLPGVALTAHAQTLGEKMTDAAYIVVLGIGTVFVMLVVIALIIYAFNIIPLIQKLFSKEARAEKEAAGTKNAVPAAEEAVDTEESDDLELVAVIAAAIAAYEQVPVDSFRVRTIKRRK